MSVSYSYEELFRLVESIKLHRENEPQLIKLEGYEDSLVIENMYSSKAYQESHNRGGIVRTVVKNKGLKDKKVKKDELDKYILSVIMNQQMRETISDIYR